MEFAYRKPLRNFVGRRRHLEEMNEIVKNESRNMVVISGLGGVGKSELARKFIDENLDVFKRIVWMNGDSEISLINAFEKLSARLELDTKDKTTDVIVESAYSYFSRNDSIFVFDNVDRFTGQNHYFEKFLPNKENSPFVIITSREQWDRENAHRILLKEFDREEAEDFLRKYLPQDCHPTEGDIKSLAKQLQNFPLALQQAVACLERKFYYGEIFGTVYSIEEYLRSLEKEAVKIPSSNVSSSSSSVYERITSAICVVTFEEMRRRDEYAENVMNIMSHFAPDDINPKDIFVYFDKKEKRKIKLSLMLLNKFCVIRLKENKIQVHRLTQKAILSKLREKEAYEETLRQILKMIPEIDLLNQISVWEKLDGYEQLRREYAHLIPPILKS